MSELTPFNFEGHDVRVLIIDDEPWWVVNDVCAVLGIADSRTVVQRLDEEDVAQARVLTPGGVQQTNIVNESGLYELIFRSDKPAAKAFRRWVTSEVLPQIRRTGGYAAAPMSQLDLLVAAATQLRDQDRRLTALENRQLQLEAKADTDEDEYAAIGYAKLNDLSTARPYLSRLGKAASRIMRARGRTPRTQKDATFGLLNIYPRDVLDEAYEQIGDDQ